MKVGLDTNVLVYAAGFDSEAKRDSIVEILTRLNPSDVLISLVVLAELHFVLSRKLRDKRLASVIVRTQSDAFGHVQSTSDTVQSALDLVDRHDFQVFDAVILADAIAAGCRILLTEDGQHGFETNGCTIVNPFVDPPHPLLAEALAEAVRDETKRESRP